MRLNVKGIETVQVLVILCQIVFDGAVLGMKWLQKQLNNKRVKA